MRFPVPGVVREDAERLRAVVEDHAPPVGYRSDIYQRRTVSVAWRSRDEHGGRGNPSEFIAIVNYGVIGLVQLAFGIWIRPISR